MGSRSPQSFLIAPGSPSPSQCHQGRLSPWLLALRRCLGPRRAGWSGGLHTWAAGGCHHITSCLVPPPAWGTSSGAVPKYPVPVLSVVQGQEGRLGAGRPTPCSLLPPPLSSVSGHLDPGSHQRILMKTGLILLIIGHLNFIAGALVHGTVLRFVIDPRDAISLQYAVANAASIISALLTISCGIAALMLSRYLTPTALKWAVFALSASSSLGCLSCLLGLAISIGLTLGSQGRVLLAPCTFVTLAPVSRECPFDPTRVYSSTLSLWAISLLLHSMEIVFSIRCLLLTVDLLRLGRCCHGVHRGKVSLQAAPADSPDPGQCLGLLGLDSVETAQL
ncbi:hypothetical protein QYF61_007999 [Mycteria americana]|uniref:Transmembrane protein 54 n=1 Tax=Mycteria americana TaxID=33587 RepID=A0AAN7MN31_MYCAM|nr:hypothetical protein QYF61_007999 [Mycteria americana]